MERVQRRCRRGGERGGECARWEEMRGERRSVKEVLGEERRGKKLYMQSSVRDTIRHSSNSNCASVILCCHYICTPLDFEARGVVVLHLDIDLCLALAAD